MTEFFDKKEDVMDIQLTQYGKHLLSMGKFKPVYYAFYDQDIIYDGRYGPGAESQNEAQYRIKNLTSFTKAQYVFRGVESHVNTLNKDLVDSNLGIEDPKQQNIQDKLDGLSMPLGTCDFNSIKSPAWDVTFLKSPLSSSLSAYSGSSDQILQIPQLETHHVLITESFQGASPEEELDEPINLSQGTPELTLDSRSESFFDNSYYELKQEYVFLDVLEKNGIKSEENFDIEVFLVEDYVDKFGNKKENLKQLYFAQPTEDYGLKNINYDDIYNNPNYVEHYFDIDVDQEIREEILCDVKFKNKIKDFKTEIELDFTCPDEIEEGVVYDSSDEDIEVC